MGMEGVVSIVGGIGLLCFVAWLLVHLILRWREISRETQVVSGLAAQVGSGDEAVRFLEAPSVQSLFERIADRRTLVLQRVLRAVQTGIVLLALGIAMFVARLQFRFSDDEAQVAGVLGTLAVSLGVAFLVAALASYLLSERWGLLKE